jgi:uncharacterized protein (TIGR00296 family)
MPEYWNKLLARTWFLVRLVLISLLISDSKGVELVRLARRAVEAYLAESVVISPEEDSDSAGVFVTLNYLTRNKEEHLRGCIGFPLPEKKLRRSVVEAAIAAASEDPRFPPVDGAELENIIFEVSVLTPPEQVKASLAEYKTEIKIGRDGLILRWRYGSGLLLPQVPVELKWDINEYLANICYKAGAPADVWLDPESKLYKFQAIVFKELEPKGEITRLEL